MHPRDRDRRRAVGYPGLDRVFVGSMTGNTAVLGMAGGRAEPPDLHPHTGVDSTGPTVRLTFRRTTPGPPSPRPGLPRETGGVSFWEWYVRRGRIDRRTWWTQYALPVAVLSVLALLADVALGNSTIEGVATGSGYGPVLSTVGLLTLVPSLSGGATRLHDKGLPAWLLLIGLVPVFGQVALLVLTGFLRGDSGPNRYGPPPVGRTPAAGLGPSPWS